MISVNNTVLQGRTLASWNMAVADPDLQISGGRRSPKKFFSTLRASFWSKKKLRPPPLDPPLHGVPFDPKPVKERMWLAMIVLHKCFRYFVSTKQMMLALKKLFNSLCETKWSSGRFVNCAIFFLVLRSSTLRKCYKAITQILRPYSLDTFTRMNTYRIRQTTTHREQVGSTWSPIRSLPEEIRVTSFSSRATWKSAGRSLCSI